MARMLGADAAGFSGGEACREGDQGEGEGEGEGESECLSEVSVRVRTREGV